MWNWSIEHKQSYLWCDRESPMHMKLLNIAVDAVMAFNVYTHFLPVVFFFALMHFDITFIPNGTRQTHCVFTSIQRFFPFSHRKPFFHSFRMLQIICKLVLFIYPECHTNHEFKSREIFMLSVCVLVCVYYTPVRLLLFALFHTNAPHVEHWEWTMRSAPYLFGMLPTPTHLIRCCCCCCLVSCLLFAFFWFFLYYTFSLEWWLSSDFCIFHSYKYWVVLVTNKNKRQSWL